MSLTRAFCLATLLLASAPLAAVAAEAPPPNDTKLVIPDGAKAGPDFDVERATEAWVDTLSSEQRARSDAYFEGGYWLQLFSFLYGLGVAWVFLGTKLSSAMRDRAERTVANPTLRTVLYALMYIPLVTLLSFPLSWYADFYREHQYGMATQDLPAWLADQAKGLMVAMIMGTLFIAGIYAVIRKVGRGWWAWGSVVAIAFVIFSTAIAPLYIAPLFNDYRPLPPGPLRERILSIAHATGVPADDVYWFDASRQTKRISANVSGFGSTMRVSLNDNLLSRTPPEGIEAVMGHELGHYVLNHVYKGILAFGVIFLIGFFAVARGFEAVRARFGARWGIGEVSDVAGLPLVGALFATFMFVATPVINTVIRTNEIEADRFGIAASNQPDGFAFVAMQLSEYRKISPGYWEEIVFYDHPSGRNRVSEAMQWKAEHGGRVAAPPVEPMPAPSP